MDYLLVALGLSGLVAGGEFLVRGAVGLTAWLRVPPLLIGLTVVGFGTSTPELLVSVGAALRGVPDIAVGNVVGSNIANILLIIGMAALIWPMTVAGATLRRDTGAMMLATLAVLPVFAIGAVGRLAGLVLVALLATYLLLVYLAASQSGEDDTPVPPVWKSAIWALAGLALLMVGARLLLDGSVALARGFGVSEAFIGLTVVAVGTSLPELATSLIAAFRRQSEIAIGNVVGSNIFNLLGVLGLTAVVAPVPVAGRFLTFDLPVMIVVSLVLTGLLLGRPMIGRATGAAMLAGYGGYLWLAQG